MNKGRHVLTQGNTADTDLVARVVHEALRAWARGHGQEDIPAWERAPDWMIASTRRSVCDALERPDETGEAQHEQWLRQKMEDGWQYGPVKDPEKKTHPLMVPWEALPDFERRKDRLLQAVVRALT